VTSPYIIRRYTTHYTPHSLYYSIIMYMGVCTSMCTFELNITTDVAVQYLQRFRILLKTNEIEFFRRIKNKTSHVPRIVFGRVHNTNCILILLCLMNSVLRSLIVSDPHTHHPHISFGWFPSTPFADGSPPFTVNHHWPSPSSPCHLPAAAAVTGLMVSYHVGRIITVMWTDTHLQCAV